MGNNHGSWFQATDGFIAVLSIWQMTGACDYLE